MQVTKTTNSCNANSPIVPNDPSISPTNNDVIIDLMQHKTENQSLTFNAASIDIQQFPKYSTIFGRCTRFKQGSLQQRINNR